MAPSTQLARSILVVDDDQDVREGLCDFLVGEGYSVAGATNGAHALAQLNKRSLPTVVLLDMRMPEMDGFQFLEERQALPNLRHLPVIIMSATPARGHMPFPILATFTKPVDLMTLLDVLDKVALHTPTKSSLHE